MRLGLPGAGGPVGTAAARPALGRAFALPQVGTSSSAEDVCSSVDGFFFPRPMILVIFFPVTLDTVPLPSDLELFFLLTVKNNDNDNNKKHILIIDFNWKNIKIKRYVVASFLPPPRLFLTEHRPHASHRHTG